MTQFSSDIFTAAVTLTEATPEQFDLAFTATTQPCPWPKAYGGDLVAPAAAAAIRSVTDGKVLHSMHSYFLRPADIGADVRYEVEVLRDGRGYSTRQVRAFQHGKPIYVALFGFTSGGASGSFGTSLPGQVPSPELSSPEPASPEPASPEPASPELSGPELSGPELAGPDALPSSADYLAARSGGTMTEESKAYWSGGRSFDMRHVDGPVYLSVDGEPTPHQAIWVKPFDDLRPVAGLDELQRDLTALTYVCDYTILEPVLRVLGLAWADPGLVTASLDHAMWFHRAPAPGVLNGWLLYAQQALSVESGRGAGLGYFFAPDGTHLASVVQEGMIRPSQN